MKRCRLLDPYVEVLSSRSGPRPVINGTRVGVDVIAGYSQAGYTPHEMVETILPQLTLAQVYDALSYYEDHRAEVDQSVQTNTPDVWRNALQQRLGREATRRLLSGRGCLDRPGGSAPSGRL